MGTGWKDHRRRRGDKASWTWSGRNGKLDCRQSGGAIAPSVGGPPCQAYSVVGRARNQAIKGYSFEDDARRDLYRDYLKVIARHWPSVFVMENVKGLLSSKIQGDLLIRKILADLSDPAGALRINRERRRHQYQIHSVVEDEWSSLGLFEHRSHAGFLVRSEDYGIPQERHRVILLGVRTTSGADRRDLKRGPQSLSNAWSWASRACAAGSPDRDAMVATSNLRTARKRGSGSSVQASARRIGPRGGYEVQGVLPETMSSVTCSRSSGVSRPLKLIVARTTLPANQVLTEPIRSTTGSLMSDSRACATTKRGPTLTRICSDTSTPQASPRSRESRPSSIASRLIFSQDMRTRARAFSLIVSCAARGPSEHDRHFPHITGRALLHTSGRLTVPQPHRPGGCETSDIPRQLPIRRGPDSTVYAGRERCAAALGSADR